MKKDWVYRWRISMRRKLFFYVLILVFLLIIFESCGLTILNNYSTINIGKTHTYYGKIVSVETKDDNYKLVIKLNSGEAVLVSIYGNSVDYFDYYGYHVSFSSTLKLPNSQRNPGCFDYQMYLKSIGIIAVGYVDGIKVIDSDLNVWDKLNKYLIIKKNLFITSFNNNQVKGFVSGILFGDKDLLSDDIYDQFKSNGTAHILAVSGLHIGVIYGILEKILSKRQSIFKFIVTIIILIFLGCMASWTPSVTRALGMVFMKTIAQFNDRRYDIITAMSVVALISIVHNPYVVFNTGFQMSYLAVLSIAFVMPHIPKNIPDFAAIILAVNFGLIPYQMYQFNTLSLTAFFANIPIVYLAGIIMPIVAASFVLSIVGVKLLFLDTIIESFSHFIITINRWCTLGTGSLDVVSPPLWTIAVFYIVVFFMLSEQFSIMLIRRKYSLIAKVLIGLFSISIMSSYLYYDPISNDQVVFIDVGQGDAVHIRDGKKDVLIDGGGNVNYNIGKNTLKPYFLKNGVNMIELALATHKHTDHFKGLEELDDEGMIKNLLTRRTAGQKYYISNDVWIETLWPLENDINSPNCIDPNQEENKYCSVFMVYYKSIKILITGDIDSEGEKKIIEYYKGTNKLKSHILKVGHHGSKYSTCDEFLDAVNPKFCVIQVGDNNYGHPHMKIIEKCHKKGIIILRTDNNGAIGFDIKDGVLKYNTMIKDS